MAVQNKYVNTRVEAGSYDDNVLVAGADNLTLIVTFEVAAADDDGSVFRIAKNLSPNLIPVSILINNDAMTGSTSWDLGLYEPSFGGVDGAVCDKDCFMAAVDLNGGKANGSEQNGLAAVAIENLTKKLYEHAGHTIKTKKGGYDLALTANTIGSAAGTVTVRATFAQG